MSRIKILTILNNTLLNKSLHLHHTIFYYIITPDTSDSSEVNTCKKMMMRRIYPATDYRLKSMRTSRLIPLNWIQSHYRLNVFRVVADFRWEVCFTPPATCSNVISNFSLSTMSWLITEARWTEWESLPPCTGTRTPPGPCPRSTTWATGRPRTQRSTTEPTRRTTSCPAAWAAPWTTRWRGTRTRSTGADTEKYCAHVY